MRAVVLHSAVPPEAPPDEQDVLVQARCIGEALERLGWDVVLLPFHSDLGAMRRRLRHMGLDVVVNLVETVEGSGRLSHTAPALLDAEGIPYTGCPTEAVFCTSHKVLAKKCLTAWGVPTPEWFAPEEEPPPPWARKNLVIVKPVWEDASVGIDQEAVLSMADPEAWDRAVHRARNQFGLAGFFAERFIDGREFNLALLARPGGVDVLPVAEMCFEGFGPDRHRIVDYEAKWAEGSFAERHTVRSFSPAQEDGPIVERLSALARRCWNLFGLRGYARIDFRVDGDGRPYVLEVNANPCLSPDAGFMAAARQAGLDMDAVVHRLVEDALAPRPFGSNPVEKPAFFEQERDFPADTAAIPGLSLRSQLRPSDEDAVERMTAETGFFNGEEIAVARDLARQSRTLGAAVSGYFFILAEKDGRVVGYTCYGPILGTAGRFDLYWIVVDPAWQGRGIGKILLHAAEQAIRRAGGRRIYVETSSRLLYETTRQFYLHAGYAQVASLPDFYAPNDHKIIYCKTLVAAA
jgi:D-alanine-D-alanine ligase-like ATP-grasp enzyme/GNAT superfamily N-acetyltransferase